MKQRRGPLIAAVAGGLVAVLVIVMLIMPKLSQIRTTNDQLTAAAQQQVTLEAQLRGLKDTESRAKAIRTQLDLLNAAVPTGIELPDLIRMLNDTADQSNVSFISITPAQPTTVNPTIPTVPAPAATTDTSSTTAPPVEGSTIPTGPSLPLGISLLPVNIQIQGSYFAVDEYLFRLESLPRLSKVTTIALALGQGGYPQLALTLTANFYSTDISAGPGSEPGTQTGDSAPSGASTGSTPAPTGTQAG